MKVFTVICLPEGEDPYVCCSFTSLDSAKNFVRSLCSNFSDFSDDENGLVYCYSIFKYYIQSHSVFNFGG